jgi:hypothetical protein
MERRRQSPEILSVAPAIERIELAMEMLGMSLSEGKALLEGVFGIQQNRSRNPHRVILYSRGRTSRINVTIYDALH